MRIKQLAVMMIRLASIQALFSGVVYLTYLPEEKFRAARNVDTFPAIAEQAMAHLRMLTFRSFLQFMFGLTLYVCARPIAEFLTRGLSDAEEAFE
jgi:hypothetical protein